MPKLVWSSDPEEAKRLREEGKNQIRDLDPGKQHITVTLDRKRRAGKTVTIATGFELTPGSLNKLAAVLKKRCGSGGTARKNEIEIQGDHGDTVTAELSGQGYRVRKLY